MLQRKEREEEAQCWSRRVGDGRRGTERLAAGRDKERGKQREGERGINSEWENRDKMTRREMRRVWIKSERDEAEEAGGLRGRERGAE